jgi:hypothetical protein
MMSVFGDIIFGYRQNGNLVVVHALDWGSWTQSAATASPKQRKNLVMCLDEILLDGSTVPWVLLLEKKTGSDI